MRGRGAEGLRGLALSLTLVVSHGFALVPQALTGRQAAQRSRFPANHLFSAEGVSSAVFQGPGSAAGGITARLGGDSSFGTHYSGAWAGPEGLPLKASGLLGINGKRSIVSRRLVHGSPEGWGRARPLAEGIRAGGLMLRSEPSSGASLSSSEREKLWDEIEELELQLKDAIESEQYSEAAGFRDQIKEAKRKDPYCKAEEDLETAVEEERYEDAAALRNTMKEVGKPPIRRKRLEKMEALEGALSAELTPAGKVQSVKDYSDTVSQNIRVQVESFYLPEASSPSDGRFLFGYNVTITNMNQETCQLVSRTWLIKTASTGRVEEVSGQGVVGRQPVLGYNESFSYSSACPLNIDPSFLEELPEDRVLGSMEGSYVMVAGAMGQTIYSALVDPFCFILPKEGGPPPSQ